MYSGQCLCGEVNVKISGEISEIIHCHCSLCRKNSGTAYATNGFVAASDFVITKGASSLSRFSFKPGRQRHFCQHCGSPVYSTNAEDASRVRVRLGIIESDITERPISHNFVTSKANWDELDAALPRYDGFEPGRS